MENGQVTRKRIEELTTEGKPKVVAKFGLGFTINIGNYESCKVDGAIELEGTCDHLKELQAMAQEEVEGVVMKAVQEVKDLKAPNQTLLGSMK